MDTNVKKMSKTDILNLVDRDELPGLKCGDFPEFTEVWMVRVKDKIYVRSGQYVPHNSWYHKFAELGEGWIQLEGLEFEVTAKVPDNIKDINDDVDQAYLLKYGKKYPGFVNGILRKSLQEYTMEFELK